MTYISNVREKFYPYTGLSFNTNTHTHVTLLPLTLMKEEQNAKNQITYELFFHKQIFE